MGQSNEPSSVGSSPLQGESVEKVARTVEERLAVMEERTALRPKSLLDRAKEWGGIATLIVALAYSFPLGVWDRWITPERERLAAELAELRSALEQSSVMLADSARTLAMISDPALMDTVGRAFNTRLYIMMAKYKDAFAKRKDDLTPAELIVIGYNFTVTNQYKSALEFLRYASEKAAGEPLLLVAALREKAKALFAPSSVQNKYEAAKAFEKALLVLEHGQSIQELGMHASLSAEWGYFEMMDGDWLCGKTLTEAALKRLGELSLWLNDEGKFSQLIVAKTRNLRLKPNQPELGCLSKH